MNHSFAKTFMACMCALALAGSVLAGCSSGNLTSATEEQQSNRSYMSQVNETMDQLSAGLDSFIEAVSRGDIVNMRNQADNAYQALDKLSSIEAPDELSDVQQSYKDGTGKLREALDAYISLFTEAESDSFDWSTYDERMASIQALYDEGVDALKKGDEAASSKE